MTLKEKILCEDVEKKSEKLEEPIFGEEAKKRAEELGEPVLRISVFKQDDENLALYLERAKNDDADDETLASVLRSICEAYYVSCSPFICRGIVIGAKAETITNTSDSTRES